MSRKWKTKDGDTSVSFDSDKKVVYVGGEFIAIDESTADNATVTNSAGESTTVDLALEFTGSKGDPNARISTLERNITILADALISGGSNSLINTVPSADKWATARTISLSGDASGSVSIDGSSNVTLTVAVANDSHTHDGRYYTESQVDALLASNTTASENYTDNAINSLVAGAPAALNTLNELAAAIGDNASYASSITTALGGKVATNSAQALRATDALQVSNDTITLFKGDGSSESVSISDAYYGQWNIAASGTSGSSAITANNTVTFTGAGATTVTRDGDNITITSTDTNTNTWRGVVDNLTSTSTSLSLTANQGRVLKSLIDGKQAAGSYLTTTGKAADSNLLDGLDSSAFLRSNANDTASGIITFSNATAATGANTGAVRVSGGASIGGALYVGGDVTAYSDERLKDNIEVIADAGAKVAGLRGVTFTHKASGIESTGLIAQDVQAVLPEAVSEDDEGMLSVKYGNLVGLLVEAVKELQAEVKALKGE